MTSKTFCDICERPMRGLKFTLRSSLGGLEFRVETRWPHIFNEHGAHPDVCDPCVRRALSKKLRLIGHDEERRYRRLVKDGKAQQLAEREKRGEA